MLDEIDSAAPLGAALLEGVLLLVRPLHREDLVNTAGVRRSMIKNNAVCVSVAGLGAGERVRKGKSSLSIILARLLALFFPRQRGQHAHTLLLLFFVSEVKGLPE